MHSQSKRPHTHDVRTLCVVNLPDEDPVLVSGGNDAQLLVHSSASLHTGELHIVTRQHTSPTVLYILL